MLDLSYTTATDADAPAIARLRTAVAEQLTLRHGRGHWSSHVTEDGVRRGMKTSRVLAAWHGGSLVATLRLATKKPWAIDRKFFVSVGRPLYLHDMAVEPKLQRRGLGRFLLEEAKAVARAWPSEAIRLDAYDHDAGAGLFYAKCGLREVGRIVYRGVPLIYFEILL